MRRILLLHFSCIGLWLTSCQVQALPTSAHLSPPDQSKIAALQAEFEQEMTKKLAQKGLDNYNLDEISEIALKTSQKVYGAHPKLMKQKILFELQQLPQLDAKRLSNYQVKESLNLNQLRKGVSPLFKPTGQGLEQYEALLPLFYGKQPEKIAQMMKQVLYSRHLSPKQLGQRTIIAQFMPDKTFRIKASNPPQIVVKTFDDNLFLVEVQVTEAGLLKPLQVKWMQRKEASLKSS